MGKAESQRTALAQQIGADGLHLLQALERPDAPEMLQNDASIQLLRQVWQQYYDLAGGKAKWRAGPQENAEEGIIRSPYDAEARTGKKRETTWLGDIRPSHRNVCPGDDRAGSGTGSPPVDY